MGCPQSGEPHCLQHCVHNVSTIVFPPTQHLGPTSRTYTTRAGDMYAGNLSLLVLSGAQTPGLNLPPTRSGSMAIR